MTTAIVVVLFAFILVKDIFPHWKSTEVKDKIIYCAFMLASFSVLILYTFNIPVPSPTDPIRNLIDAIFPTLNQ